MNAPSVAPKAAVRIRVLVVEDSLTVRKHIVDVLSNSHDFQVVGEASDGKTAVELCLRLSPDVVTMDMMLPIMTGLAATEYIMAHQPTAILVVSSSMNRGEQFRTYDALAAGAVDVLEKPNGFINEENWNERLLSALRLVSRVRVIRHPRALLGRFGTTVDSATPTAFPETTHKIRLVAIGASTGGPGAMHHILCNLPEDFNLPILLVIHIAEPFGRALTDWLGAQSKLEVRYAREGEPLPRHGCVLMAPPGQHLECPGDTLRLTSSPERHSCRPSVDVLFESLATSMAPSTLACLLTGMGKDGAKGLRKLKDAGAKTVAQDEGSSIVFGMPAEAIRLGAADMVLPLSSIPQTLARLSSVASRGRAP